MFITPDPLNQQRVADCVVYQSTPVQVASLIHAVRHAERVMMAVALPPFTFELTCVVQTYVHAATSTETSVVLWNVGFSIHE